MRHRACFIFLLTVALLLTPTGVSPVTHAQETTQVIAPLSGRYTLEVPAGWLTSQEEISGLQGFFLEEIVVMADSAEALRALQINNLSVSLTGRSLVANVFPTALAWTGSEPATEPAQIFPVILGPLAEQATYFEIDGYPAARTDQYFGAPYDRAAIAGQTAVIVDDLVYLIVYSGPDAASLADLHTLAATLKIASIEPAQLIDPANLSARSPLVTADARVQVQFAPGWLVSLSGSAPEVLTIITEPAAMLDYYLGISRDSTLPGLLIRIETQPYEWLFGTSAMQPTADDRSLLVGETLASLGGESSGGLIEITRADGIPALQMDVQNAFSGANSARILLFDPGQSMYVVTFIAPTERWESDYLPLIEAVTATLVFNPLETTQTTEGTQVTIGLQIGQQAPNFSLQTLDGETVALQDFRGQIVLLNFWATWCPPCRVEMPDLQSAYAAAENEGFVVLAINLQETAPQAQTFVDEFGLTFPILLDPDAMVTRLFNVTGFPTSYILDRDGIIRERMAGALTRSQIEAWIALATQP